MVSMPLNKPLSKKTAKRAKEVFLALPTENNNISVIDIEAKLEIKSTQIHNYLTFLLDDVKVVKRKKADVGSVYYYWRKDITLKELDKIMQKFMRGKI